MTFNEGWIEVRVDGARMPLNSAIKGLPTYGRLPGRFDGGRFWVPHVGDWAKARAKDIYYVDNCWLYVAVTADELHEFLIELLDPKHPWARLLIDRIDRADSYVIVAEEF